MKRSKPARFRNRILARVDDADGQRLLNKLELLDVELLTVLFDAGEKSDYVFFPETCVTSMVRVSAHGPQIEVGIIGSEGVVGVDTLSDLPTQPNRATVQYKGQTWRAPVEDFRSAFRESAAVQSLTLRYLNAFLGQVSQSALCNRLHNMEQRLAKWLLTMRDRVETDEMPITQEFLSHMLGARLPGVNEAVGDLVKGGLIQHRRSHIRILDRKPLEAAACECYAMVKPLFA